MSCQRCDSAGSDDHVSVDARAGCSISCMKKHDQAEIAPFSVGSRSTYPDRFSFRGATLNFVNDESRSDVARIRSTTYHRRTEGLHSPRAGSEPLFTPSECTVTGEGSLSNPTPWHQLSSGSELSQRPVSWDSGATTNRFKAGLPVPKLTAGRAHPECFAEAAQTRE